MSKMECINLFIQSISISYILLLSCLSRPYEFLGNLNAISDFSHSIVLHFIVQCALPFGRAMSVATKISHVYHIFIAIFIDSPIQFLHVFFLNARTKNHFVLFSIHFASIGRDKIVNAIETEQIKATNKQPIYD